MQPNGSLPCPAPAGPARAFAADASRRLLPTSVREGDRVLRLLAAVRSVLVVHLARAANAVAAYEVWHLCCYRTRTDFARERLDRDGRWLRDMIRLHEALERLPRLRPALCGDDGSRPLGQVATLLIARVATPEDVETWIARARTQPLDELRAAVAAHLRDRDARHDGGRCHADLPAAPSSPATGQLVPISADATPADEDDEATMVTLRQRLPPDVKWAFEAVRDLHRHLEGSEVSAARFVADLVGEAASSGCLPPDDFTPRLPARAHTLVDRLDAGPRARHPAAGGAAHADPPGAPRSGDPVLDDPVPGDARPGDPVLDDPVPGVPVPDARGARILALHTPAMRRALQRLATFDRLHRTLARLDEKLRLAPRPDKKSRTYRRDARRIARILEHLLRVENGLEIDIGDLLLELHEHEAWEALGFSGLEAYAEARLGLGGSTARRRVGLARALRLHHLVRKAYERGHIGFMAAEWISRALRGRRADTQTQHRWIAHARTMTLDRLRQEERHRDSQRLLAQIALARANTPGVTEAPECPTNSAGTAATAHFSPLAALPMDDATWRASLRRAPGQTRSQVIARGYGLLERLVRGGPLMHASLCLRLPAPDAAHLLGCIEAARRGLTALDWSAITPAGEHFLTPSARMARDFVDRGLRVPEWVGLLAVLEEFVWVNDDPRSMPRRSDHRVLERDGYRCQAPGCTARARLHLHHLQYRSHQGTDEDWNLLVLCSYHHLQGEHGGLARVRGRAPLDVLWRLGCDEFALSYRNDRRLDVPPA